ncbi:MAG: glycosyl transferase, partial [Clostridiales bacterium]|nr:glycosyl transferase [Clostridiales bacterium]
NGFQANRQFYLTENGKIIFYSAEPSNCKKAVCKHSQNYTEILYSTGDELEITRRIFILPQIQGLPLATEVQRISITNSGKSRRNLRLVYTGMFGSAAPHALFEDVLYSNVIMQTGILRNGDGTVSAIFPDYYPKEAREDLRFHTMMVEGGGQISFPEEFCGSYNEFVGSGSLAKPEGVLRLSNKLSRKGPGFFALAASLCLEPIAGSASQEHNTNNPRSQSGKKNTVFINNFTGLVSKKVNPEYNERTFENEISSLIERYSVQGALDADFERILSFFESYRGFVRLTTSDKSFDAYFNNNLPFQVLYQTFVSRSFCQTQKGYREIGFREIQDIYASMYYFVGMGKADFVKQLLKEWAGKVFEFGYSWHNFYWEGKEAGKWSDDALWLVQAVYRYINLTGDKGILDEECDMADNSSKPENKAKTNNDQKTDNNPKNNDDLRKRPLYETLKAIIRYSGGISVGKHGIPLLDFADWNDCLKLDPDFIDGPEKERRFREAERPVSEGRWSESIMNGFLLKLAIDQLREMSEERQDLDYNAALLVLSEKLSASLQRNAWKGDFFARVLFNRYENGGYSYLGAGGDGLSTDTAADGTYYLNSFTWALLSGVATEEQIGVMLETVEANLKTPAGLMLCTLADLDRVAPGTAAGHYFPGDRENGAVFKHAAMMAASAMLKAAREVSDRLLAEKLAATAYWAVDMTLPYKTLEKPFEACGNPRFCTQYTNSETGENIGPMLSGTSTWLTLTLFSAFGLDCTRNGIKLDPILRSGQRTLEYKLNIRNTSYCITIEKPEGFRRRKDSGTLTEIDGVKTEGNMIPYFDDGLEHSIKMTFILP